jgi:hypothetical protein
MARRGCESCGKGLEGKKASARFCGDVCRKRQARGGVAAPPSEPPSTAVADALGAELEQLEMAATYEGRVAVGIARQLDNGTVVGAAYASLSRELDRRVDALRLKAERADDPAKVIKGRFEEKRAGFG